MSSEDERPSKRIRYDSGSEITAVRPRAQLTGRESRRLRNMENAAGRGARRQRTERRRSTHADTERRSISPDNDRELEGSKDGRKSYNRESRNEYRRRSLNRSKETSPIPRYNRASRSRSRSRNRNSSSKRHTARSRSRSRSRSHDRSTSHRTDSYRHRGGDDKHDHNRREKHSRSRRRSRSQSPLPQPHQRSKAPLPSQNDAFTSTSNPPSSTTLEKQKPNFGLTGKLAAASNTIQTANQTIVLKYHEPAEARKPPAREPWRLYVFKDDEILETVELAEQSCWLFGRETAVADLPIEHLSCSKQHAVIQFRYVGKRNEFGDKIGKIKPYVIDLESANGTSVNGEAVPTAKYVELRDKDVVKFGHSTREYVIQLPTS